VRARLPRSISEFAARDMLLGVRPEHLEICDEASAMLMPDIDFIELLGSDLLVYGQLDAAKPDSRIAARLDVSSGARKGRLPLRFDGRNMHLFDPQTGNRISTQQ